MSGPHPLGPGGQGGGHPPGIPPSANSKEQQASTTSYAAKVTGKGGREKLNILDIVMERKDNSVSFNLSKEELAKLLFRKLQINPNDVLKIDTSGFGKIQVEFGKKVKPEDFINLPAFDIKEGVRTKFYKPHHRKEILVTIVKTQIQPITQLN